MPNSELEFFDHDKNITRPQVEEAHESIIEKILNYNPESGFYQITQVSSWHGYHRNTSV